jgi:hypothetical protein
MTARMRAMVLSVEMAAIGYLPAQTSKADCPESLRHNDATGACGRLLSKRVVCDVFAATPRRAARLQ